jgi:hypothetical protein
MHAIVIARSVARAILVAFALSLFQQIL